MHDLRGQTCMTRAADVRHQGRSFVSAESLYVAQREQLLMSRAVCERAGSEERQCVLCVSRGHQEKWGTSSYCPQTVEQPITLDCTPLSSAVKSCLSRRRRQIECFQYPSLAYSVNILSWGLQFLVQDLMLSTYAE